METLKFFSLTPNVVRITFGSVFIAFLAFCLVKVLEREDFDPVIKTIIVTLILIFLIFCVVTTLRINKFSLSLGQGAIIHKVGTLFFNRVRTYAFEQIKTVDLRLASSTDYNSSSNRTTSTTYYAVLVLEDDEIFLEGSADEDETKGHTKELALKIGKPFYVNFNAKDKSKNNDVNLLRILLALSAVFIFMYCLFLYFSSIA